MKSVKIRSAQFSGPANQFRLKTRLKLKRLRKDINICVEENFGYSPSGDQHFDKLMNEMEFWSDIAYTHFIDLWYEHIEAL